MVNFYIRPKQRKFQVLSRSIKGVLMIKYEENQILSMTKPLLLSLCICTIFVVAISENSGCGFKANELINAFERTSRWDVEHGRRLMSIFEGMVKSVLNKSCIAHQDYEYCPKTLPNMKDLAYRVFSNPANFVFLYDLLKFNMLNWTQTCVFSNPRNQSPDPILDDASLKCKAQVQIILSNISSLSLTAPLNLSDNPLERAHSYKECFNQTIDCNLAHWIANTFFDHVRDTRARNRTYALFQYRENAIYFISSCYNRSNGTTPPQPSPNASCASQLSNISRSLQRALNTTTDYSNLIQSLRESKSAVENFVKCIENSPKRRSKICQNLTRAFYNIYLQTIFSTDLEEAESRTQTIIEDIKDVFQVCKLQTFRESIRRPGLNN
eukprot:TRINITY_DN3294_c0_g1_i1.p1 TRINITY_DN3294_c0_g1~~TRINITY_DN3294_c0_g1_i1.p1  ORF type:complete len:382 (-),score=53.55 TRINITY_DN3294_c0_g1_i1:232-1377(-)